VRNLHTIVPSVPAAFNTHSESVCVNKWHNTRITSIVFGVRSLENKLKNRFKPDSNSTALPNI
jgi:hypothetical protein